LGISLEKELQELLPLSNYIHISDNDGLSDSNQAFLRSSELYRILNGFSFENKIFTVEVYSSMEQIKESYNTIESLANG
jgi:hypothetical protein